MTTKLTLSMDPGIVAKARRISKHRGTSISALVAHYIASIQEDAADTPDADLPPITRRVLEIARNVPPVPAGWDYRDELSDVIAERFGVK